MAENDETQAAGREVFRYLGTTLFVLRHLRNMSQTEFAEVVGIRPNQLSRYETGAVTPHLDQLGRLLAALEIEPYQLFLAMKQVERLAADLEAGIGEEAVMRAIVGSLAGDLKRAEEGLLPLLTGVLSETTAATRCRRRRTKGGRRWTQRETGS